MRNVDKDKYWGISYKEMKTLNEIDKIRMDEILSTGEKVSKRFDTLIDLLRSGSKK
ncbi:hypothetical protein [Domibacillus robiginosus]|uniref:hypothetical protein n=1 Tax=Domibacillus robiginosus TaxID=1071054 RepID=UPI000AE1367B|nr:hypothetical protein [Domibacillus robiginosus]